ncbi:LETM1-domain-containing protein [Atractiella rhizophila]|nr:LETM1-domain-containing protein [Atractiella rhizophila]
MLQLRRSAHATLARPHLTRSFLSTYQRTLLHPSSSLPLQVLRPHPYLYTYTSLRHSSSTPPASNSSSPASSSAGSSGATAVVKPKAPLLQRAWATVKKEAKHYWHGTKLLGKEIRISTRLQIKLLKGKTLTRRERRQLKRTTQDLLRLLPFSVFVIVPFMELLLPVALKLFPNMLPSTFEDRYKAEEKRRKLLKVRLEMAKFLQETLRESGLGSKEKIKQSEEFKEFFRKVRSSGEKPSVDDIVKVARLFENDLTLDNLSRPQLVSICRYMNINAFGTDNFLRYTIRQRMTQLKSDDTLIDSEGVSSLNPSELLSACLSRGIRTPWSSAKSPTAAGDLSEQEVTHLRSELTQWIDLHVHRGLSGTLLILSKAFAFTRGWRGPEGEEKEGEGQIEGLRDTLASLPDTLLNETELAYDSDTANYSKRLAVLQEQEELIEDEAEQELREEEARKAQKEKEEEQKKAEEEAKRKEEEEAKKAAPQPEPEKEKVDPASIRMSKEQVSELGEALSILSAKSSVLKERQELAQLMEENKGAEESTGEDAPAVALNKRIRSMIKKIDKQLEDYDKDVGHRMNIIHVSWDGKISTKDLRSAFETIRHRPSDEAIDVLVSKLDPDGDGYCPLKDLLELMAHPQEGLGVLLEEEESMVDEVKDVRGTAQELREKRLKKEDVVEA